MALEFIKNEGMDDFCSILLEDGNCAYEIIDAEILFFDGEDIGQNAEIAISNNAELIIEIDFDAKNGVSLVKEFHCVEHAVEFAQRNLSGTVRLGYLIFALKWDTFQFYGEMEKPL